MGAGDERRDVRIGKITLPHGGEARNGSIIVSCTGGCIGIGVPCWRLEHVAEKGRSQVVDEMTLRLIEFHLISTNVQKREHMLSMCLLQQDRRDQCKG